MYRMVWRLLKAYAMYRIGKAAMRENSTPTRTANRSKTRGRAPR